MNKLILLAAAVPLLSLQACTSGNAKQAGSAPVQEIPVISIITQDTALHLQYVADIQARRNVEIHARLSGLLEQVYVDEGQHVRKGQLLFSMNDDELLIALSKADAALKSAAADAHVAQVERERVRLLVDKKIITKTELDLATAKWRALQSKIEEARAEKAAVQKRISYTRIHSPFDGVIDRLPLKPGSLLTEGSLLTTISDISSVYAYFNISESEYLQLMRSNGDDSMAQNAISLVLPDGTTYPYKGSIVASGSEIDDKTGSIAFRADFSNPRGLLKHGASATLHIARPASDVLMVPQKSVLEIQDKNYVFVVDANNVARMKAFRPAHRVAGYYIVADGLRPSERIVYEGIQSIRDGERIRPVAPRPM